MSAFGSAAQNAAWAKLFDAFVAGFTISAEGCETPDTGWSDVHLIITETGLPFCSETCHRAMEDDCGWDIMVVAESGSAVAEPYGDVAATERGRL